MIKWEGRKGTHKEEEKGKKMNCRAPKETIFTKGPLRQIRCWGGSKDLSNRTKKKGAQRENLLLRKRQPGKWEREEEDVKWKKKRQKAHVL